MDSSADIFDGSAPYDWNGSQAIWAHDFITLPPPTTTWLIEPYLPQSGVVFLHGPTSVGKSPLVWELARCVSTGAAFFGYPVQKSGSVLYIELDTPPLLLYKRLAALRQGMGHSVCICPMRALDILNRGDDDDNGAKLTWLNKMAETVQPVLVIVNTLRKSHRGDDKESDIPSQVYATWQQGFPGATILFVHHDKKYNPDTPAYQQFSGSNAWSNDAQVSLQITRDERTDRKAGESHRKTTVTVVMHKNQAYDHERVPPLKLRLSNDGANWETDGQTHLRLYFQAMDVSRPYVERVAELMQQFNIGRTSAYDAVKGLP